MYRLLKLWWGSTISGHLPSGSLGSYFRVALIITYLPIISYSLPTFSCSCMMASIDDCRQTSVYDTVFWFRYLLSSGCGLIRAVIVVTSLPRRINWLSWGSNFLTLLVRSWKFFLFLKLQSCSCYFFQLDFRISVLYPVLMHSLIYSSSYVSSHFIID
jgi:hypothetical protein